MAWPTLERGGHSFVLWLDGAARGHTIPAAVSWYLVFFLASSGINTEIRMYHLEFSSLETCGAARAKLLDNYTRADMAWPPLVGVCVQK